MIAIVDYGVGNLFSLGSSLESIGADSVITGDPEVIHQADHIILPGVGAFGDAARQLRETGMDQVVLEEAGRGKPILGICLGMQLLMESSEEYGHHQGLGLIPGNIVDMRGRLPEDLLIPHMGWNSLDIQDDCAIFKYVRSGQFVYFVHSFYGDGRGEAVAATCGYGVPIAAAVHKGNIYGCQFHPEKSGPTGLAILRGFCES